MAKNIQEIEKYVSKGLSQSASNCRMLLREIHNLRNELKKTKSHLREDENA